MSNTPTMSVAAAAAALPHFMRADTPVLLLGPPGVGKTAVIEQYASSHGVAMATIHGSHYTPVNLMGIAVPDVPGNKAVFLAPEIFHGLHEMAADGQRTMLFIDELTTASATMQALFMQLCLERKVAGHTLPDGCMVVLAGNRQQDKGPVFGLNSILTNRMAVIETLPPTVNEWTAWAITNEVHPIVIAYLNRCPARLHDFDPARYVNPTPRQWERVSDIMKLDAPPQLRLSMAHALVGAAAVELEAIMRLAAELPSFADINESPATAPLPAVDNLAAQYVTVTTVVQHCSMATVENLFEYILRMPDEMQVVALQALSAANPAMTRVVEASHPAQVQALLTKLGGLL